MRLLTSAQPSPDTQKKADANLIDRLREMRGTEIEPGYTTYDPLCAEAADRLAALIAERDNLKAALEYARPLVLSWCHTQGTVQSFFDETLAPIDVALSLQPEESEPKTEESW